jgi:N-acetylmuramoyl-L-alanine amidase
MKIIILLLALCASVVYSQELTYDQKIVAMTIVGEARGEGKLGMYAVGAVIAQRVIAWKKTPAQVCLKKSQFSCWNPNDPNRAKLPRVVEHSRG